jgi:PAS domain S-box-containing protein
MESPLTTRAADQSSLLETILHAVGDGIIVFAGDGRLRYANEPGAVALGASSVQEILETPLTAVMEKFEIMDENGQPFPLERLPGRLALAGEPNPPTTTLRFRIRATGEERWSIVTARPLLSESGGVEAAISIFRDITDLKRAAEAQRFLGEATEVLNRSLHLHEMLASLAHIAVPTLADWCIVHSRGSDGAIEPLVVAHADEQKVQWAEELGNRWPPNPEDTTGIPGVLRSGQSELYPEITEEMLAAAARDEEHLKVIRSLGMTSVMTVPIPGPGGVFGTMTFVSAESGRRYDEHTLELVQEFAQRAGFAVQNARLYREAEERAHAALVLSHIDDGVFLLDEEGVIRLWNSAAESITGLPAAALLGKPAEEAIPGWKTVAALVPVGRTPGSGRNPMETVPLELGDREIWISISGVGFEEGTVYAFRDLTEERRVEELKTDFLATASHELRTPVAAVYGAAMTLRRSDLKIDEEAQGNLLEIITSESDRLTRIVDDILWAGQVESGHLALAREQFDAAEVGSRVVAAARAHLPQGVKLTLRAADSLPVVSGDSDKVRQVLANLVDNAVKYSPDGGAVDVRIEAQEGRVRFSVRDEGLGIPPSEQARIFEKFYRLDPNLTRGVGGTGLGLYICRELVRRMGGRIWVASSADRGSTFFFELPISAQRPG